MTRKRADARAKLLLTIKTAINDAEAGDPWAGAMPSVRRQLTALLRERADAAAEAAIRPWPPRGAVELQERIRRAVRLNSSGRVK